MCYDCEVPIPTSGVESAPGDRDHAVVDENMTSVIDLNTPLEIDAVETDGAESTNASVNVDRRPNVYCKDTCFFGALCSTRPGFSNGCSCVGAGIRCVATDRRGNPGCPCKPNAANTFCTNPRGSRPR